MPKQEPRPGNGKGRRQRGSISADEIINGAFEVAQGVSLDEVSMPSLAKHLGIGITSIYWYFRKKEELLNAMTDVAVEKYVRLMPPLTPGETWQRALREHFEAQRRIQGDDPTLADLMLIRTSTYSRDAVRRTFELQEAVLGLLIDQGFTPENALYVYNNISVYTRGAIIHDRILRLSHTRTLDTDRQRRMTDWGSMPILGSLIDEHQLAGTNDVNFGFGIDRLLCGFEQLLAEQGRDAARPKRGAKGSRTAPRKTTAARRA